VRVQSEQALGLVSPFVHRTSRGVPMLAHLSVLHWRLQQLFESNVLWHLVVARVSPRRHGLRAVCHKPRCISMTHISPAK